MDLITCTVHVIQVLAQENQHYFFSVTNVPISFFDRRNASSIRIGSSFMNLSQYIKH